MKTIFFSLILWCAFFTYVYYRVIKPSVEKRASELNEKNTYSDIFCAAAIILALAARIIAAPIIEGHKTDMSCWAAWATELNIHGLRDFYSSTSFCDYPPGYLYILYILGKFSSSPYFITVLKLPAIIFDGLTGLVLYRLGMLIKYSNPKFVNSILLLYLFNPLIFINSAIWGQVDSILTFFVLLTIYALDRGSLYEAAIYYGFAVLFKPQALLFLPVILYWFAERIISDGNRRKWLFTLTKCAGIVLLIIYSFSLSFSKSLNPAWIVNLYKRTLSQYPFTSLNAFNFYTLFGANYFAIDGRFFYLTYRAWSFLFILLSILFCGWIYLKSNEEGKIYYVSALFISLIFTFAVKMHERYLFPSIVFYYIAYMVKRDRRILTVFTIFTIANFTNVAYVLYCNLTERDIVSSDVLMFLCSAATVFACVCAVIVGLRIYAGISEFAPKPLQIQSRKINRLDCILIAALTLCYACFAFYNLGDMKAPKTSWHMAKGSQTVLDFGEIKSFDRIEYFKALGEAEIGISASFDNVNWTFIESFKTEECFTWYNINPDFSARYVKLQALTGEVDLLEMGFFKDNVLIRPFSGINGAFDEQDLVPVSPSYKNSMYFDEIYHARTAYEHIHRLEPYENTHPPLGKLIISLSIMAFGMTPFGWRFPGTLLGVLMVPLMYLFGKKLFGRTEPAFLSALFIALDGMHFVQTRIATIDTYVVFFIMLMYYFMYDYFIREDSAYISLMLSGIAFGLGIASKWTGFYAGAGLAVLYFSRYKKINIKSLLWCALWFIIVPFVIYFASYIPILTIEGNSLADFWGYQRHMFDYHSELVATHPYSSAWFQWPTMIRPVFYYSGDSRFLLAGMVSSIVCIGNIALWLAFIPATCYIIWLVSKKVEDRRAVFLLIAYAAQYLPWMLVPRLTFMYHYFASIPFLILILVYSLGCYMSRDLRRKQHVLIYAGIVFAVFCMYYPILTGAAVYRSYVNLFLRGFETWGLSI